MRSAAKIKVSDHALKYRMVTDGPHTGPWRHEFAPHTVKIMDTYGLPHVREVWFCAVEQSGKTTTMLNCLEWGIDVDPGDVFWMMPTEKTGDKITGGKIIPMLKSSPHMAKYLSKRQDDTTMSKIKLNHGMTIHPAHANSASSTATWSAKHCFGDEVDKNPPLVGKETDSITLIKKRNRLYKGRYKRFFASTPAGMFIYKGMLACTQVWEYRARCRHCDSLIKMDGDHLILPENATPEMLDGPDMVRYACNECGVDWNDADRMEAIRTGRWFCVKGADVPRPSKVGFHHRSWDCLDIPLVEIAIAWLQSKDGSVAERIAWANGYEAIDYVYEQQDRSEDHILRLVDPAMPRKVVPRDISCIVLLVDAQRIGFHYEVVAYGWGRELESWRIDHGFLMSFQNLKDKAAETWLDADGKQYRIHVAFIDSGGGTNPHNPKHSRTAEIYEFCRQNPLFRPLKGRRTMEQPWNVTRLDFFPGPKGKKVPIPGGLRLYIINVTMYKNELSRKLNIEPSDPGAYHLHADMGKDYAKQLCAEYQDDHGWWVCPKHKPNHHWDIGVYGLAAADILQIRIRRKPSESGPARKVYSKGVTVNG
jgi:phage terminase large subunit GpA-like protein